MGLAVLCYAVFLFVDVFLRQMDLTGLSSTLKYAALLACVTLAASGEDPILRIAMLITAVCDFLLLFTQSYVEGIFLFLIVQMLHSWRFGSLAGLGLTASLLPAGIVATGVGVVAHLLYREPLLTLPLMYGCMLLNATVLSFVALSRKRCPYKVAAMGSGGMLFFVLCDVCVAAHNMGVRGVGVWMWVFYLPSQLLLAFSAPSQQEGETVQAEALPQGWHVRKKRGRRG